MRDFYSHLLSVIVILTSSMISLHSQSDMTRGFDLLESQSFEKAALYFEEVLANEPNNKTARICFGRAIGLGGNIDEGLKVFKDLASVYPDDYEVQLNLAEALMWDKSFDEALIIYESLLARDNDHFVSNLGFANANAALHKNKIALKYITKALDIDPENESGLVSKKYILLALADEERRNWNYLQSHLHLDEILNIFPNDKDALSNRAVNYLSNQEVKNAEQCYKIIVGLDSTSVDALLGLSYTRLLSGDKKESLLYAQEASQIAKESNSPSYLKAVINEANALVLNRRFNQANVLLDSANKLFPANLDIYLARARHQVWNNDARNGLKLYNKLLDEFEPTFEMYMGIAEAYRSLKERSKSIEHIEKALVIEPKQPDATRLLKEIKLEGKTVSNIGFSQSSDIGGNNANDAYYNFEVSLGDKHRPFIKYHYRQADGLDRANTATQQRFKVGDNWIYNSYLMFNIGVGGVINSNVESTSQESLLEFGAQLSAIKYHELFFQVKRAAHNYSSDLIKSGIMMNHYSIGHAMQLPIGIGTYSQVMQTHQTDGNQRNLAFLSTYYNLAQIPTLKIGVSGSYMTYAEKVTELYFSPSGLTNAELFLTWNNIQQQKRGLKYHLDLAAGMQKIDEQLAQKTYRIDLKVGYRITQSLELLTSFNYNNAAQANAAGYSFTRFGLDLKVVL